MPAFGHQNLGGKTQLGKQKKGSGKGWLKDDTTIRKINAGDYEWSKLEG